MYAVIRKASTLAFDIPTQGNCLTLIFKWHPRTDSTFTVEPLQLTSRRVTRKQIGFLQVVAAGVKVTKLAIDPAQAPYCRSYQFLDPRGFGAVKAISRSGFVSQRCQLKATKASIVLSDRMKCGEPKKMKWILVSSAASAFDVSGNVGSSQRHAWSRTYSQQDNCICFRIFSSIRPCCCINDWTTGTMKSTRVVSVYFEPVMPPSIMWQ
jgi:hypothetical protein